MNPQELAELKERRNKVAADVSDIQSEWKGKEGQMPPAVEERLDKALLDFDTLTGKIEDAEVKGAREQKAAKLVAWLKQEKETSGLDQRPASVNGVERKAFLDVFGRVLRGERHDLTPGDRGVLKAYQSDNMAGGGFFIAPIELANEILTLLKDEVFVRGLARTFPLLSADSLGIPAIDVDPGDADWTTELRTGNEETTAGAGRRELKPNPFAKRLKLSKDLIRRAPNFEEIILERIAYKAGVTEEKAFLTGDGSEKPLGVFTPSAQGVSTGRDVTAANANKIVGDDLVDTEYKLKAAYRKKAQWCLSRGVLGTVRKLKDANGNYIWTTGIGPGQGFQATAPTLLGMPYFESEYAPNTPTTTGTYQAVLGDWSYYWIADALDMEMQVLDQLYAETNQMGYILRKKTDGMPVLEEAFARLKLA